MHVHDYCIIFMQHKEFPHLPGISSSVYIYGYLSWSKEIFTGNREGSDERKFLLWTWVGEGVKGYMCSFRQFYYLNLISSWITRECVLGEGGGVGYPTASSQPVHLNKPKLDFVPSPSHPSCVNTVFWYFKKITVPFCEFWQNFLYIDVLIMNN